jgi:Phosphotransferase enzyme family
MSQLVSSAVDSMDSSLACFLNAAEFEEQLALLSCSEWDWGPIQAIQTRVLKCHPNDRCTFEINLKTDRGAHELIGKVFASERSDIHDAMVRIQKAGFDQGSRFAIPRPLTYLPSLRVLLEEKAHGASAREILLTAETSQQKEAAVRCAHWLARFHTTAPRIGPVTTVNKMMFKSKSQTRKLARLGSPFAEKSGQLLAELEAWASKLAIVEICASHGEYNPSHTILNGDRTVVIDWDKCQVCDPARDVATFMVVTKWLALDRTRDIGAFDSVADTFFQAYLSERGPQIVERLPFHLATVCLKHAKYCAAYRFDHWEEKTVAMLEEGFSAIRLTH